MTEPVIELHATAAAATGAVARRGRQSIGDIERQAALDTLLADLPPRVATLAGTRTVCVDRHLLRTAVTRPEVLAATDEPFHWKAVFVRRSLGLAILAHCLDGWSSTPTHAAEIVAGAAVDAWRRSGDRVFGWEPWMAGLGAGARAAVLAEAITWSTGALSALDWSRLSRPVHVAPPDDVWSCDAGRKVVVRGRCEARGATSDGEPVLVLVSAGAPTRELDAELGLPALAAVLRAPRRPHPVRVVGVWPDAGMAASAEVDGALLTATTHRIVTAVDALARAVGAGHSAAAAEAGDPAAGAFRGPRSCASDRPIHSTSSSA
jgi:hypothetical protein